MLKKICCVLGMIGLLSADLLFAGHASLGRAPELDPIMNGKNKTVQTAAAQSPGKLDFTGEGLALSHSEHVNYSEMIESESKWIAEQQIINEGKPTHGAIVMNKQQMTYRIDPYFSNLSILGLLEHPAPEHIEAAKRWFEWYFNHMNRTEDVYGIKGTVYVYYVDPSNLDEEWTEYDYSASDSRGSSFVLALKKYYDVTGDRVYLLERKDDIELALDSALFTMQPNGLTYAKNQEGHYTQYLQDNSLVYKSLETMAWLEENVFEDEEKAAYYRQLLDLNYHGVEQMFIPVKGEYYYYYTPNRIRPSDWSVFYGDAVSQIFPIRYGVILPETDRAAALYNRFNAEQPNWMLRSGNDEFPWVQVADIAAMMGDKYRVDQALKNAKEHYIDQGHRWTWYIYEAGNAVSAAKRIRDQHNLALRKEVAASSNEHIARYAVDGWLHQHWESEGGEVEWLQVDLGETTAFNRIVLKWGEETPQQYKIQISEDGQQYTDIYLGQTEEGQNYADLTFASVIRAKQVKLWVETEQDHHVNLSEFEIYYEPENLAEGKTVTASSHSDQARFLVDGDASTKWSSDATSHERVKIDLGESMHFNKIVLDWNHNDYDANYQLLVSDDDVHYRELKQIADGKGGVEEIIFPVENARYIQFVRTSAEDKISSLYEIRVYNDLNRSAADLNLDRYTVRIDGTVIYVQADWLIGEDDLYVPVEELIRALDAEANAAHIPMDIRDGVPLVSLQHVADALGWAVDRKQDVNTFNVYKDPSRVPPINLALHKPVQANQNIGNGDPANVTDGLKAHRNAESWNVQAGAAAVIDLGELTEMNAVKVFEYSFQRLKGYAVSHSLDGEQWITLAESETERAAPDQEPGNHYSGLITFDPVETRYVQFEVKAVEDPDPSKTIAYIEEIEIYRLAGQK